MKFPDKFEFPEWMVMYLTGNFPFSTELQAFWMAFQGAMAVRAGPNKDRSMHWFHAFMLTVFTGYAGASFTPLWMGMPTSMLSNDLNLGACAIAFFLVNCMPYDLGYKLGSTLPVTIITTTFAQLFRSLGIVKFTTVAHEAFKNSPSQYYPIPVFGPIAYGTILGNMGGFFSKGFTGYLENGMPWPFQNGTASFCLIFYPHEGLRCFLNCACFVGFSPQVFSVERSIISLHTTKRALLELLSGMLCIACHGQLVPLTIKRLRLRRLVRLCRL